MPGDPEKRREYMRKIQNPISKYDKKGNLIYTGVKEGGMARGGGAAIRGTKFQGVF